MQTCKKHYFIHLIAKSFCWLSFLHYKTLPKQGYKSWGVTDVTYFCGHNASFIDGLRPTLEAPSTSWSEWMPTGVHSSDTGIRDEMR
jgi:hypothetical protein